MSTSDTIQNYILYRTAASGWQAVGYVIAAMQLTAEQATGAATGFAYALDTAGKYPAGSIYTPTVSATTTDTAAAVS
ncbi:hypothetical protein [Komagataeibacter sp. FNDCF1]|uniref:hypothetical protein n=1 Tax=Komagataeibacter sp. FNDCF1 TaxID=2878681 RepID=UPI001E474BF7|nr:hypothetical protein [Komagataeibacter sp. FNDCF1]MCE2563786.1 hypothetical protein [Komagataeibacter sp. FNDCF1]MCE2566156.1 hypothetical protein [Komagataeibacter sp. FNDCF1]